MTQMYVTRDGVRETVEIDLARVHELCESDARAHDMVYSSYLALYVDANDGGLYLRYRAHNWRGSIEHLFTRYTEG